MTRYTNLGRKRTHLEAGFSNDAIDLTPGDTANENALSANVDDGQENLSSQPPAKKQKRVKQKKSKQVDGFPMETGEKQGVEPAEEAQDRVKQAYSRQSREKNRKREAVKTARSELRRLERRQEKLANTTCFACREKGHAAKDCPKIKSGELSGNKKGKGNAVTGICYRCGSSKHTLSRCKKPGNPDHALPFASCFVCSGKGHLASSCPRNKEKGVYPNGGCCKLCGETSHLARNCPTRKQANDSSALLVGTGRDVGADEDDFHSIKRVNVEIDLEERTDAKPKKRKRKEQVSKMDGDGYTRNQASVRSSLFPPSVQANKKVVAF